MNTEDNLKPIGNTDAGQTGAADGPDSHEAKAIAGRSGFVALALLALIPILCNVAAIPGLGETVTGWGKVNAYLFQLASLLINPATAILGVIVARRLVGRGSKGLAYLGGSLALVALVPMFTWSYFILWPIYLACGITMAAAALIIGSAILDLLHTGAHSSQAKAERTIQ